MLLNKVHGGSEKVTIDGKRVKERLNLISTLINHFEENLIPYCPVSNQKPRFDGVNHYFLTRYDNELWIVKGNLDDGWTLFASATPIGTFLSEGVYFYIFKGMLIFMGTRVYRLNLDTLEWTFSFSPNRGVDDIYLAVALKDVIYYVTMDDYYTRKFTSTDGINFTDWSTSINFNGDAICKDDYAYQLRGGDAIYKVDFVNEPQKLYNLPDELMNLSYSFNQFAPYMIFLDTKNPVVKLTQNFYKLYLVELTDSELNIIKECLVPKNNFTLLYFYDEKNDVFFQIDTEIGNNNIAYVIEKGFLIKR